MSIEQNCSGPKKECSEIEMIFSRAYVQDKRISCNPLMQYRVLQIQDMPAELLKELPDWDNVRFRASGSTVDS